MVIFIIVETAMSNKIQFFTWVLFLFSPFCVKGEGWFKSDSARFGFRGMPEVKEACAAWQRSWKAVDSDATLLLPNTKELDSVEVVLPYLRVYPDTLTGRLCREYVREKIALVTPGPNVYFWYLTSSREYNRLTIGGKITDVFRKMLSEVKGKKNVHLVYFIEGEYCLIPSHVDDINFGMILGYSDKGRDSFLDEKMQVYESAEEFICSRYGSMEKYMEYYRRKYVKEFVW